ncbi:MAG: molecular chaperone TorD family protein [Gemmatimonadetes bacterium]|nr:molecular chaperone TorD family protein [Gemmatimonadota bacterium]MDA1103679.1 molecular chaperone TorD family protein [Gemmatimonadota bacterium]
MPDDAPLELIRSLAVIAEPPGEEQGRLTQLLDLGAPPTASEYSDVFLFQLYPYASVHVGSEGMMGGEARDRVAGFWTALGHVPPAEPDHLAALLGLYASLGQREHDVDGAERALVRESRHALLNEHLAPWVFAFLARVQELASGAYAAWASLLYEVLLSEARSFGSDASAPLPLHLRLSDDLPDPRTEGGDAWFSGLLAPVRAGMILTRADLARIAGALDLGLRAGERRYALEHLLAQDPISVLGALAAEARRQGAAHAGRSDWLGPAATFCHDRAMRAAALLEELAEQGATHLRDASEAPVGIGVEEG